MKTQDNLKVLETLIDGLEKLKLDLPPNLEKENEIKMYLSGINCCIFLADLLLENNGDFPENDFPK